MNLLDLDTASPAMVFAAVQSRARARDVDILRSEVVGLVPERAILAAGAACLKVPDAADHLLEEKIRALDGPTLDGWLEELAGGAPAPGGGSAAALAGAPAPPPPPPVAPPPARRKAPAAGPERVGPGLGGQRALRAPPCRVRGQEAARDTRGSAD